MASLKNSWVGRWAGGRIQEGVRGKTWWIERRHGGDRYAVRLVGVTSDKEAVKELARWEGDPKGYKPPVVRDELASIEAEEAELAKAEAAANRLVLNDKLIEKFVEALTAGYGTRKAVSSHHAFVCESFLSDWSKHPDLIGWDLREVPLARLRAALESGRKLDKDGDDAGPWGSQKHRIVALRSLTAWLRWRGDLKRAEDPTLDLNVPQARRPTPEQRAEKVYDRETLELTYKHTPNQDVRDIFFVRLHTGLHETEIARIAAGEATIRRLKGQGRIAATLDVRHKSGQIHRQSVDEATLARIDRLRSLKTWPTEHTLARNRLTASERASEALGTTVPEVFIGDLRHTRTTLGEQVGEIVYAKGVKKGVPIELIARSHGHAPGTAATYYSGTQIPPMIVVPLTLVHPDDP